MSKTLFFWKKLNNKQKLYFEALLGSSLIVLILLALGLHFDAKKAGAVWFDDNFAYRQTVALTNSGSAQTDYQVVITLDTASLTTDKMQADCDDLRVTDVNGRVLPYWIETGTNACDTSTTAIWTKVPSIPTSGATLYIYYGNPSATSRQNGSKVFEFFDDFEKYSTSTNIDGVGGWTTKRVGGSGSAQVTSQNSRNHLTLSSTAQRTAVVQPVSVSNSGYAIETAVFVSTYTDDICVDLAFTDGNVTANGEVNNGYETCWWGWGNAQTNIRRWDNGSATTLNSPTVSDSQTNSTYYKLTFSWTGSTLKAFKNGSLLVSATDSTYTSRSYIHIGPWYTATTHHDWIGVRKAAATEPSVASPASEEKAVVPVAYWKFDDGTGTNANDSSSNNQDGTLTSGPTWQIEDQCVAGKCIFFDGSDDHVSVASDSILPSGSNDRTISFWVRPNSITVGDRLFSYGAWTANNAFDIDWHTGSTSTAGVLGIIGHTNNYGSTGTVPINKWTYVSVVLTGGTAKIYFNGALDSSQATSINTTLAGAYRIGGSLANRSATNFKGFMDEPKIYNYARSAAQIQADYNARANSEGASAVLGAQNQPAALSNGLVGYWKMDESSWTQDCTTATATDSSGNGNTGKSCPSTTGPTTGAGKFGNGGVFDASNDRVQVTDNSALDFTASQNFTFAVWVKNTTDYASGEFHGILGKGDNAASQGFYNFHINSTEKPAIQIGGASSTTVTANTSLGSSGAWNHVVAVFNRTGTVTFYLNGQSDGSGDISGQNVDLSNDDVLYIGSERTAAQFFGGTLDEVRIYNRELSANDISQLYNFAPGPVGYWRFDERSGTSAFDSSGNANTGTLTLGPTYTSGRYGASVNFDGSDDYVTVSDSALLRATTITISTWVKLNNFTNGVFISSRANQTGVQSYNWGLWVHSSGRVNLVTGKTSWGWNICSASTTALTTGKWYYVTAVINGATSRAVYVNGIPQTLGNGDDGSTCTQAETMNTTSASLVIGAESKYDTAYFGTNNSVNGSIDETKIYNYARTAGQVIEDMNAGHPAPGSPVGSAVAYWKFDEGADNTCSGGSNDACNSGSLGSTGDGAGANFASPATAASGWTQSGKFGKALLFDGTDDVITAGDNFDAATGSVTISAWVKTDVLDSAWHTILSKGQASFPNYALYINTSNKFQFSAEFQASETDDVAATNLTLATGTWYHVVGVRDTAACRLRIYVNGNLENTVTPTTCAGDLSNAQNFTIGRGTTTLFWDGTIDEAKVYLQALTADQVKLDMNRGSSQVLGALSDNSTYQTQAANQEYCIPGDSTSCVAPVGRWDFEEGTGNANDTSGNGYTATPTGTTIIPGKIGKARNFNGTSDYMTASAPGITGDSALTIEGWVYRSGSDVSAFPNIIAFGNAASEEAAVLHFRNTGAFAIGTKGGTFAGGTTTSTQNQWFHVAGTYSGSSGTWRIYVNGIQEASQAESAPLPNIGTTRTSIGVDPGLASQFFAGKIDQVRVFNYARSAAQIAWDYNKGGPVGWWKFDECQGTTANDSAGNSLSGTITPGSGGQTAVGTCTGSAGTLWKDGVTGKRNYSLDFDGTDDYISLGNPAALQITAAITVTGWIKTTTTADGYVFSRFSHTGGCAPANNGYIMGITTSNANAFFQASNGGTGTASVGTRALNDGNWHQLVGVFEGTNSLIYVDGKLDKSTAAGVSSIGTPSLNPNIGRSYCYNGPDSGGGFFTGQIDDVRVYNYAFTAKQVQQLYTGGAVGFQPSTGAP